MYFYQRHAQRKSSHSKVEANFFKITSKIVYPSADRPANSVVVHSRHVSQPCYLLANEVMESMYEGANKRTMSTQVKLICSLPAPFKKSLKGGAARKEHITQSMALVEYDVLIAQCNKFCTISTALEAYRLLKFSFEDAGYFLVNFITEAVYSVVEKLQDESLLKFDSILCLRAKFLDRRILNFLLSSDTQRHLKTYMCECGSIAVSVRADPQSDAISSAEAPDHDPFHAFILSYRKKLEVNDSYSSMLMSKFELELELFRKT